MWHMQAQYEMRRPKVATRPQIRRKSWAEMGLVTGSPRLDTQDAVDARANRTPEFTGNKTEFVCAVVESRGSVGAAPKDIDQVFEQRGIKKSKNATYNALVSLVRQKKLKKKDGQYFYIGSPAGRTAAQKGTHGNRGITCSTSSV